MAQGTGAASSNVLRQSVQSQKPKANIRRCPAAVRETTFFARGKSVGRSVMAEWQLQTAFGADVWLPQLPIAEEILQKAW
jgi:hypothetical protein